MGLSPPNRHPLCIRKFGIVTIVHCCTAGSECLHIARLIFLQIEEVMLLWSCGVFVNNKKILQLQEGLISWPARGAGKQNSEKFEPGFVLSGGNKVQVQPYPSWEDLGALLCTGQQIWIDLGPAGVENPECSIEIKVNPVWCEVEPLKSPEEKTQSTACTQKEPSLTHYFMYLQTNILFQAPKTIFLVAFSANCASLCGLELETISVIIYILFSFQK